MLFNVNESHMKEIAGGSVASPRGFMAAGIHSGIRRKKKDLGILFTEVPAVSAAVYTANTFQAAPLEVTRQTLYASPLQKALIVNSGNANAFTGKQGIEDAIKMKNAAAEHFQISPWEVLVASTGVIGERLPMKQVLSGIKLLPFNNDEAGGLDFGEAIMTTDTMVKSLAVEVEIDGKKVTIGGTAKGSGMIHPNMGTMLGFITTDANVEKNALDQLLKKVTNESFNMITVDGDTSTNDMVVIMANGLAGNKLLNESHPDWMIFYNGVKIVATQLAKMIARDGEGATKLITVKVFGAKSQEMAASIAKKIVGSNLVKTAIFGADGNWGRIVMAIGNSGYQLDEKSIDISIGKVKVLKQGQTQAYQEEAVIAALQEEEVIIQVDLHLGNESKTAWGCDLSYDYVKINASYRT